MVLIGWKAALRTDDLHRLDIADLRVEDGDTGRGLAVRLRRSKTEQTGRSITVGITASELPDGSPDPLDAIAAWVRWHNLLRAHCITRGPAWRGVDRYGRRPRQHRLQHQAINLTGSRRAAAAGLEGEYGGTRCGGASPRAPSRPGVSERAVQRHGAGPHRCR